MKSLNFEFLRPQFPEMAELSAFAESYIHSDPSSACVKLRAFAELLTSALYARYRFPRPQENEFVALLNSPDFRKAVPAGVQNALHGMRKEGNQAAHGGNVSTQRAAELLFDAFKLSHWWSAAARGEKPGPFPTFIPPPEEHKLIAAAGREEELAAKIAELEKQQANYEALSRQPAELDSIRAATEQSANLLHLSESETRQRLIDRDLAAAGWTVGYQGTSTAEVTQEHPLATGERADYVLWDVNGKPLAVVEAKKTCDEFMVSDHFNADETRSVKTLSGGESFLASLSLALALAESITQLNGERGAVSLESLFLDEGFSTLDSETLTKVADAIELLQDGNRLIGIITHVQSLAEQMPVRIEIEKTVGGSRIIPQREVTVF